MTNLTLYTFEDPGLYYGVELLSVVARDEGEALDRLEKYLRENGREDHILKKVEYTAHQSSEKLIRIHRWKLVSAIPLSELTNGVVEELSFSWMM